MPLFLTETDVTELVTMADAMREVEAVMTRSGRGSATNSARRRAHVPGGVLHVMFGADPEREIFGLKSYTSVRGGNRFHILLYSSATGELLALLEASRLGQLRTGAASGVATRCLARPDARIAAVFGAGYQAATQVEAVGHARALEEVRVFSRSPERRRQFCEDLSARLGLWVLPVDSPEAALDGAEIICTITTSARPVFDGNLLAPGAHVNAAGSNSLLRQEIDLATVTRSSLVTVDSREAVALEGGDLLPALQRGQLFPESLVELGTVLAGHHPGRPSPDAITLFKSHGIALQDLALADLVYRRALERGIGREL